MSNHIKYQNYIFKKYISKDNIKTRINELCLDINKSSPPDCEKNLRGILILYNYVDPYLC